MDFIKSMLNFIDKYYSFTKLLSHLLYFENLTNFLYPLNIHMLCQFDYLSLELCSITSRLEKSDKCLK
jgi:hypothetical protein